MTNRSVCRFWRFDSICGASASTGKELRRSGAEKLLPMTLGAGQSEKWIEEMLIPAREDTRGENQDDRLDPLRHDGGDGERGGIHPVAILEDDAERLLGGRVGDEAGDQFARIVRAHLAG